MTSRAIWHDVENAAYGDDLPLWEELAAEHGDPVLDLGAGTGRVTLHLARRGFDVHALDIDEELVAEMQRRAAAEDLNVTAIAADAREFDPVRRYPLVIGPMQIMQIVGGADGRREVFRGIAQALEPGGRAALAIVEGSDAAAAGDPEVEITPDVREADGWVRASLPLDVTVADGRLHSRRLRQLVSPAGHLTEAEHVDVLDLLDAGDIEREGAEAGLLPLGIRALPESDRYVDSVVVFFGKES